MDNEFIRNTSLALPFTTEDLKWGDNLCFLVAEKIFCIQRTSEVFGISFKCSNEDFALLSERDGIGQAPHMAKSMWVTVENPAALNKNEWIDYIKKSYDLIVLKLTRKVKVELGLIK